MTNSDLIHKEYIDYIKNSNFPCVAAKTALRLDRLKCLVVQDMRSDEENEKILGFIYDFIKFYRSREEIFHSLAIIFEKPDLENAEQFEKLIWQKLQALSRLDAKNFKYDCRVDADPHSEKFSFSLGEEAFFVVGLQPHSSRLARRFKYPALVFNPHDQFEKLREKNCFERIKATVRFRDKKFFGSINPMLEDYGNSSEVMQYSGKKYDSNWKCPLRIFHAKN
ncbi:MAG: hypothetical protein K0R25_1249 [Rickettsiaceae bacterium]|jgi:FPC/CPF motif-containing protein YcgG|nr:hypothetical protein [Rickettsiaceae bacterium]